VLDANYRDTAVKYTAVLPKDCLDELKALAAKKIIPSVSQGIRLAVEDFVAAYRQRAYEDAVREAAADQSFIRRTLDTQEDFAVVDAEGEVTW